ncbi:uncharacterized protein LOC132716939 [Ruditapes philippinarum]|uniref:uncharacterized protein LOC132716939 n=1 Tax=Ruditapes philippinarum TaxID=129788 RepID=UPI00295B9062|nr:uncharacterized protein LOC132716939 [Ruditapes philippinarum]
MHTMRRFMSVITITILVIWFYIHFVRVSRYGVYSNHSRKLMPKMMDLFRSESIADNKFQSGVELLMGNTGIKNTKKKVTHVADVVQNTGVSNILEQIRREPGNMSLLYAAQREINIYLQNIEAKYIKDKDYVPQQQHFSNPLEKTKGHPDPERHRHSPGSKTETSESLVINTALSKRIGQKGDVLDTLHHNLKKIPLNDLHRKVLVKQPSSSKKQLYVSRLPLTGVIRQGLEEAIDPSPNLLIKQYPSHDNTFTRQRIFIPKEGTENQTNDLGQSHDFLNLDFGHAQNNSDQQSFVLEKNNAQPIAIMRRQYINLKNDFTMLIDRENLKTLFPPTPHQKSVQKIRDQTCNNCFVHNFSYIINNANICQRKSPMDSIFLFIMIFTTHENFEQRDVIRKTWLTYASQNTGHIRYAFLLGESTHDDLHEKVLQENSIHHDILKEDFVDTYMNLTYKTIMGFKWVVTHCPTAQYVFKTDDDMFINIPNLMKFLEQSGEELDNVIAGSCFIDAYPDRDNTSKWFVSKDEYKEKMYPSFCSGTGYLTSMNVVDKIYRISPNVAFYFLEDIYIGFCLRQIGGTIKDVKGFHNYEPELDSCAYKGDGLITAHWITPEKMEEIWKSKCFHIY